MLLCFSAFLAFLAARFSLIDFCAFFFSGDLFLSCDFDIRCLQIWDYGIQSTRRHVTTPKLLSVAQETFARKRDSHKELAILSKSSLEFWRTLKQLRLD